MRNFKMMLEASGTLASNMKLQYIRKILRGDALCQFDTLCDQVVSMTMAHLIQVILGLCTYFFPVNVSYKKNCAMHLGINKPCKLIVRCYADILINIHKYFAAFPGEKAGDYINDTQL